MTKPLLLDLYCCQGGASAGYAAAGFEVVGVDISPQPRYPFAFEQWDALASLDEIVQRGELVLYGRPAAIHASPPCQGRTNAQKIQGREHPRLIGQTRELLMATGLPYVIENVPLMGGAEDVDPLKDPVMLCGATLGLRTYRHRLFETNWGLTIPEHQEHAQQQVKMGRPIQDTDFYQAVGNFSGVEIARQDMGVPWMNRDGIRECIPPVYAEHVGRQLMEVLR
jgi:DNA (cytosine-5)-methyltransferase 1